MSNKRQQASAKKRAEKRSEAFSKFRDGLSRVASKIRLSTLLENKRLLRIVSVVIAFVIWASVSTGAAVIESRTIKDVPIDFDSGGSLMSDYALRLVSSDIDAVDVTVKGPRYVISAMTADNISIVANTGGVTQPGEYALALRASLDNTFSNTTVQIKTAETVTASYDRYSTQTLPLEAIDNGKCLFEDEACTAVITVEPETVTVTGPANSIATITRAVVYYNTGDEPIENDISYNAAVTLLDSEGNRVTGKNITTDISGVRVNLRVEKIKEVAVDISLRNAPEGFAEEFITFSPSTIRIQGSPAAVDQTERILVFGSIDVATLTESYNVTLPLVFSDTNGESLGVVNTDGVNTVKVSVDYSRVKEKTVSIKNFVIEGIENISRYSFTVEDSVLSDVKIMGKSSALSNSSSSNLVGVITIDPNNFTTGSSRYNVEIRSEDGQLVWAVGSYGVTVVVTKN